MNESSEKANSCSLSMAHGIALITINGIICVLGSLGNLLVCLAIATNSRLRRASYYLLFSLAIADLIVTLICEPLLLGVISWMAFVHECAASVHVAYLISFHLSCTTSVLHMVAISLDRFVAVVFPLRHRNFIEECGLKVMLTLSWSIPILAPALRYIVPRSLFTGSFTKFLRMTTFAVSYFFIFFFYFLIVAFLLHHRKTRKQLGTRTVSVKFTSRMEVRVAHTLAVAMGTFTACWIPLIIAMGFCTGKPLVKRNIHLLMWLRTLALSNSAMNFLIYSAKMRDFRNAYVGILRKMLRL